MNLDFSRCRSVWVPDDSETGGFWNPPFDHVKTAVKWIIDHPYALLGDEMGLSKTASAIIAAQFLHDADEIDNVIVIAPASVRSTVWFDEGLGQLHEQVFEDKYNIIVEYHQRVKSWQYGLKSAKPLTWHVSNYEFCRNKSNLSALLPYATLRTMLILDESSAVRSYDSKQTEACMRLRWQPGPRGRPRLGKPRCGRILEMNGTPIAESPLDIFPQANLLHPSVLDCRYVTQFKARYAIQVPVRGAGGRVLIDPHGNPIRQVDSWTNLEDLTGRMAPYILRREAKEFGVDFALPPVGIEVPLTPATWKAYREMRDDMVIWLKSGVATSATAAIKSIRLSQITSGFVGGIESAPIDEGDFGLLTSTEEQLNLLLSDAPVLPSVQEIGREKLDFSLAWHAEMLRKYPELKLLMWCRFVPELKRLLREEHMAYPTIPLGVACGEKALDNDWTQKEEREHALRLLHPKTAPKGPATVAATQGTGALGLNFTACRTVLDVSYDFSSFKKKQGDARVNRTGQTGPVSFFYLIAVGPKGQRTIDHHVMMTRTGKMQLNDWTTARWIKALTEE